jgi:hypothetical protein
MKEGAYILVPNPENQRKSVYATVLEDLGNSITIEYDDDTNTQDTIDKSSVIEVVEES